MIPPQIDRILLWVAAAHLTLALLCLFALFTEATPILGVHPALKPLKFAFSIGVFLATMALLLPALSVGEGVRRALAWTLAITMILEMVPIAWQPLRGTTSHFNMQGAFNTALWRTMMVAIVTMTMAMVVVAILASSRPLRTPTGDLLNPILAMAWRAGLWIFLLAAVSGFSMGGRLSHSVGGADGGLGLPVVNWSTSHGDLRVSHFLSLHALQALPVIGYLLVALPIGTIARWIVLFMAIGTQAVIALWTLFQAWGGRPV
jgi:hypothetical protein